jgi:hypothetical protein
MLPGAAGFARTAFAAHWSWTVERSFIGRSISSHLQTQGRTVVTGSNIELVNAFVDTLSMFLEAQERGCSRYASPSTRSYKPDLVLQGIYTGPREVARAGRRTRSRQSSVNAEGEALAKAARDTSRERVASDVDSIAARVATEYVSIADTNDDFLDASDGSQASHATTDVESATDAATSEVPWDPNMLVESHLGSTWVDVDASVVRQTKSTPKFTALHQESEQDALRRLQEAPMDVPAGAQGDGFYISLAGRGSATDVHLRNECADVDSETNDAAAEEGRGSPSAMTDVSSQYTAPGEGRARSGTAESAGLPPPAHSGLLAKLTAPKLAEQLLIEVHDVAPLIEGLLQDLYKPRLPNMKRVRAAG